MASVTNTYARAFADVVFSSRLDPTKTLQEAQGLAALVATSHDLRQVWRTPSISIEQKRKVLDAVVMKEGVSRPVRNFLAVLIDHRRVEFLDAIVKQFELELNHRMGFIEAEISSSRDLNQTERSALESRVGTVTGKKVRASYSKDASLLGGAVIRVGSTIYDGSVKGELERIREAIRG